MLRQQLIVLSLFPPATFGLILNWTIVVIVFRFRTLHRSFEILTATLATCHGITSLATLLYIIPMIALDISILDEYSWICGCIALVCYEFTCQTHLSVAINRFIAVFIPFSYNSVYNPRTTKLYITLSLIISVATVSVYVALVDCRMEYDKEILAFSVTNNRKCDVMGWTMIFVKNLLFSLADIVLHVITLFRVVRKKKNIGRTSESHRLQETYFLKQTFGHAILMSIELVGFTVPFHIELNGIVSFLISLFLWSSIHAAEGLVTLVYNSEIRRKLQKRKTSYRISVTKLTPSA